MVAPPSVAEEISHYLLPILMALLIWVIAFWRQVARLRLTLVSLLVLSALLAVAAVMAKWSSDAVIH
jgi:hypothetical protein